MNNEDTRKYLLKNNLLGKLMNGLSDPTNEVVIETAGALRYKIIIIIINNFIKFLINSIFILYLNNHQKFN